MHSLFESKNIKMLIAGLLLVLVILFGVALSLHLSEDASDPTTAAPTQTVKPHEHQYAATVFEPSYLSGGYTLYSCDCGDNYQAELKPQLSYGFKDTQARYAFVYDNSTGEYLYAKGQLHRQIYPASITKLLTGYIAILYLDLTEQITVGDILSTVPSDSSTANLKRNDRMSVEDMLYAMLLRSGNDAARVVAVEVGKKLDGPVDKTQKYYYNLFIDEMNRQAQRLGMADSHFMTADGYHHSDHYTSMADLCFLGRLAMSTPVLTKIIGTEEHKATIYGPNSRKPVWKNTNQLLRKDTVYYCEYAVGMKTGYTSAAGQCLLSAVMIDGKQYIIGVFGCDSIAQRFTATRTYINTLLSK